MNWELFDIFSMIGIIAFAVSGAIVAMEEEFDILGVFVLGMVTAFGGGIIRNLLIGVPVPTLWSQGFFLNTAAVAIVIVFVLPAKWIHRWKRSEALFDAIGLSAFSIQGALYAMDAKLPLSAVIVAAMLTGIGGGMVRDMMAGRKPLVLREEIYAMWAICSGLAIGLFKLQKPWELIVLFTLVVLFRMLSVYFRWRLPRRSLHQWRNEEKQTSMNSGG